MSTPPEERAFRGIPLQYKVPIALMGLLAILLTLTLVLTFREVRGSAILAGRERLERFAVQLGEATTEAAATRRRLMAEVAASSAVVEAVREGRVTDAETLEDALQPLRTGADSLAPVLLWVDGDSVPLFALGVAPFRLPEDPELLEQGGMGMLAEMDGRVVYPAVHPVRLAGGERAGTLLQIRSFGSPEVASRIGELIGPEATVFLVDERWARLDGTFHTESPVLADTGAVEYVAAAGTAHLAHAAPVPGTPWRLVVDSPRPALLAGANRFLRETALLLFLISLLGAAGAWIVGRRLTDPLRRLSVVARSFGRGDYSARVNLRRADEIGLVARTFDAMAGDVERAHQDLQERVRESRALTAELERTNRQLQTLIEEAEQARAQAEAASHAKSGFLATVSHEIRTPINAIVGYTDLLLLGIPGQLEPAQVAYLERVRGNGRHLARLVDDLLDLSKIEAGQLPLDLGDHGVADAVEAAIASVRPMADAKGVALLDVRGVPSDARFRGDGRRVEQILINLLSNAIKFTPTAGQIEVEFEAFGGADEPGRVEIRVRDNGIGIPPDKQELVFERFVQGDSGFSREHGGAGLGLSISRDLARMMGGDILLRSGDGEGSCFTVRLPAASQDSPESPAAQGGALLAPAAAPTRA